MSTPALRYVKCCGVWTSNEEHFCVPYSSKRPCTTCGADTVFVTIGAPGTGSGYSCRNGHYDGTVRELSAAEVR